LAGAGAVQANGSLLLGSGAGWQKLQHDAEAGLSVGIEMELVDAA
jgi:hypothetical protein